MTFLQELSKKLTERWATVLLGPGLLFVTCVAAAAHQRFVHALDFGYLQHYIQVTVSAKHDAATIIVAAAVVTAAAVISALIAAGVGQIIERISMPTFPKWYVDLLTSRRRHRWDRADARLTAALTAAAQQIARDRVLDTEPTDRDPAVYHLRARRDRISGHRPDMPTWSAQRMDDVTCRVRNIYGLDLATIWPYVWNVASGDVRKDLSAAQGRYGAAARLTAWGLLYPLIVPALWWWPAFPLAAILFGVAWRQGHNSIDVLARLVERVVDLNIREVSEKLGVAWEGPFTSEIAKALNGL